MPNFQTLGAAQPPNLPAVDLNTVNKNIIDRNLNQSNQLGNIGNNLYNDGPPSIIQGGPSAVTTLGKFDIFSTAHWFRGVASEVLFLPKFVNDPISKQGKFVVGNSETISKSVSWLATNFLLTSLNSGDIAGYGPLNMVWNPLSLPLTALLPARVVGSVAGISPTAITLGATFSNYKMNVAASVVAGSAPGVGEKLLQMRGGLYTEVSPVARLQHLRSPIPPPGFVGNLNGPLTTIDDEINLAQSTGLPGTVDLITNGNTDQAWASTSVHTNLYNQERPYNQDNAAYSLINLETDFKRLDKAGLIDSKTDLKSENLFSARAFPGAGLQTNSEMTYIVKPFASFATKRGFNPSIAPEQVGRTKTL